MNKTNNLFDPNSTIYAFATLIVSSVSCLGTWLVPYVITLSNSQVTSISVTSNTQGNGLFLLILDIGWTTTFVVGSISTWGAMISLAVIVDQVFEFNVVTPIISRSRIIKLTTALILFYLFMSMWIWTSDFSSVFVILRNQTGAMIIGSLIGFSLSGVFVSFASNQFKKRGISELSSEERAFLALLLPVSLMSWLAILTLSFFIWSLVTVTMIFIVRWIAKKLEWF